MELFDHQKKFLELNPKQHLLCWDTGTFKTRTSIEWFKINPDPDGNLVIVPKALKANWYRENKKWNGPEIMVITKEEFKRDWRRLKRYGNVVIDEGHYFAGMKSDLSKCLISYLRGRKIKKTLFLTATPYRSSPWDIFRIAQHLGYEWNFMKWRDRFFEEVYIGRGGFTFRSPEEGGTVKGKRVIRMRTGQEEQDHLMRIVAGIGSIVSIQECADVPEQVDEVETFELTKQQIDLKTEKHDPSPIIRYTRFHQIENGVIKGDDYNADRMGIDCLKNERLLELCQDNKKIIIVCRYNLQIDFYKEFLKKYNNIYVIRGDVKNRDEVVQQAEAAEKAIVLIQAACSEGYELPSFPLMVFASMDYSYVNYKQMRGRILRLNKLKKNVYLHLVSKGIDMAVYNAIMKKQDFSIALYAQDTKGNQDTKIQGEEFSN